MAYGVINSNKDNKIDKSTNSQREEKEGHDKSTNSQRGEKEGHFMFTGINTTK